MVDQVEKVARAIKDAIREASPLLRGSSAKDLTHEEHCILARAAITAMQEARDEPNERLREALRFADMKLVVMEREGSLTTNVSGRARAIREMIRAALSHKETVDEPDDFEPPPEGYEAILDDDGVDTGYRRELATGMIVTFDEGDEP